MKNNLFKKYLDTLINHYSKQKEWYDSELQYKNHCINWTACNLQKKFLEELKDLEKLYKKT